MSLADTALVHAGPARARPHGPRDEFGAPVPPRRARRGSDRGGLDRAAAQEQAQRELGDPSVGRNRRARRGAFG